MILLLRFKATFWSLVSAQADTTKPSSEAQHVRHLENSSAPTATSRSDCQALEAAISALGTTDAVVLQSLQEALLR